MGDSFNGAGQSHGLYNGNEVQFEYQDAAVRKLIYRQEGSEFPSAVCVKDIVCYVPINANQGTLITVESPTQADSDGPTAALPTLKTVIVSHLPQPFQEYCSTSALWKSILNPENPGIDHRTSVEIDVVVSTRSGASLVEQFFSNLVKRILDKLKVGRRFKYSVHYTQSSKTISELTLETFVPRAVRGVRQLIILLSGDGGILDIVNVLLSAPLGEAFVKPTVALLPMGTGNALAHSTGITNDNTFGLSTMMRGYPYPLPLFRARISPMARYVVDGGTNEDWLPVSSDTSHTNIMYGAVVCSWGLHAAIVADSDTAEYRKYGAERFKLAAKQNLYPEDGSEPHHYRARVSLLRTTANGEIAELLQREEHSYVLGTMVSNLEKDFTISPNSKPLDGKLRLVHFGPKTGNETIQIMNLAYQGGQHIYDDAVGYEEDIEGFRIDFQGLENDARWRRVCIDGKIVTVEENGWVEVRKAADKVLDILHLES